MLTPLRAALGDWRPGARPGTKDPLGAALSVWPEAVGETVARATRPLAVEGNALLVGTPSSAWSHQLSYLAPTILAALAKLPATRGIATIRFRVIGPPSSGRLGSRGPGPSDAQIERPSGPPPATPEEALARAQHAAEAVREAKLRAGWKCCIQCGTAIPAEGACAPCAGAAYERRSAQTQRLMFDLPWLGFAGTADLVEGLRLDEYETIRRELLARWWSFLNRARLSGRVGCRERLVASSYLLLQTGWEPDRITPAIARNVLGDELVALLFHSSPST